MGQKQQVNEKLHSMIPVVEILWDTYSMYQTHTLPPPKKPKQGKKQLMNRIQLKGIKRVDLVEACRQSLAVSVAQEDTPFLPITSNQHNGTLRLISGSVNSFKKKNDCIKAKCHSA